MIMMTNQDDAVAAPGVLYRFNVDLGHQRAGGVDHPQITQLAGLANAGGHAMSAINKTLAVWNFIYFVNKDRALGFQFFHHVAVVDDLFAHIDRRPKGVQRNADNINGPHNSGAKTPGLQQ